MSDQKIYKLDSLKNMIGEDESAIRDFVKMFLELANNTLQGINESLDKKDYQEVGAQAHKLKSSIDLMGIEELKKEIRIIEKNSKENIDVDSLPSLVEKLNTVLDKVFSQLKADFGL